jgi:hypothetical protein
MAGILFLAEARDFFFSTASRLVFGPHPASYSIGTGSFFLGDKVAEA